MKSESFYEICSWGERRREPASKRGNKTSSNVDNPDHWRLVGEGMSGRGKERKEALDFISLVDVAFFGETVGATPTDAK